MRANCKQLRQLMSLLLDDELAAEQRRVLDEHLASCPECQQTMDSYRRMGTEIRRLSQEPPAGLRPIVMQRMAEERRKRAGAGVPLLAGLRILTAVAAIAVVAFGLVFFWQQIPPGQAPGTAAVATGEPYRVPTNAVVKVRFDRPMDMASVERAVSVKPEVKLSFRWEENTLEVAPAEVLHADTLYTITVSSQARDEKGTHLSEPLTVALQTVNVPGTTTVASEPQIMVEEPEVTAQTPTQVPDQEEPAPATEDGPDERDLVAESVSPVRAEVIVEPTVVESPVEGGAEPASPTPADQPGEESPGTAVAAARATPTPAEPATATPKPTASASATPSVASPGNRRATPAGGDTTVAASETVSSTTAISPTATITATASVTSTVEPSVEITPTVALTEPVDCEYEVGASFEDILSEDGDVLDALGCASADEREAGLLLQSFQGGLMYLFDEDSVVYVVLPDGEWIKYDLNDFSDESPAGTPAEDNEQGNGEEDETPEGMLEPAGSFGIVWRNADGIREMLGWALEQEQVTSGAYQAFDNGLVMQIGVEEIYIFIDQSPYIHMVLPETPEPTATGAPTPVTTTEPSASASPSPIPTR